MISSRNTDLIPDKTGAIQLSKVRLELQQELQSEEFLGRPLLDVWVNEESGAESGDANAWDVCLSKVDDADVLIVIYNGQAGWTRDKGGVGICQEEMAHAWNTVPGKVFLIRMGFKSDKALGLQSPDDVAKSTSQNREFAQFLDRTSSFTAFAGDHESLKREVRSAVLNAIIKYFSVGRRAIRMGEISRGPALDWSRLSYEQRKSAIEKSGCDYFISRGARKSDAGLAWDWGDETLLVRVHGVPASFGIAEARELVGRPYLSDHALMGAKDTAKLIGPLHSILCHKTISESQVISFMGHPDLFLVKTARGFFVADRISFVQAVFLTNAIDDLSIRAGLQNTFEWIESQVQERGNILARARSRAQILRTVAAQIVLYS